MDLRPPTDLTTQDFNEICAAAQCSLATLRKVLRGDPMPPKYRSSARTRAVRALRAAGIRIPRQKGRSQ